MPYMGSGTYKNAGEVLTAIESGSLSPYEGQIILSNNAATWDSNFGLGTSGSNPWNLTPAQEKSFNNILSRYQSQNALLWQGQQLQQLGLANSGVLQTGAAHTAADMSNQANNKANRTASIANSMINMAGRMGAAGIHGAALTAVKGSAAQAASTLAHSASSALSKPDKYWMSDRMSKEDQELLDYFDGR